MIVIGIVLLLLDFATDYLCDWWSATCRRISSASYYFYVLVLLVVLAQSIVIWRTHGIEILVKSVGGLFSKGKADYQKAKVAVGNVTVENLSQNATRLLIDFGSWAKLE